MLGSNVYISLSLVFFLAAQVSQADLLCYVCENCGKVNADTPLMTCNEEFFNPGGSTEASTATTTMASPSPSATSTTDETESSTLSDNFTTTTETKDTTDTTTSPPTTTTESMPTPQTAGPIETTTGVPTPPEENLLNENASVKNVTVLQPVNGTTMTSPTTSIVPTVVSSRQRRSVASGLSYHCYTVQKTINNTEITERGCTRVGTYQDVCTVLEMQNHKNEINLSSCNPCSMNRCNGSGALQVSILSLLMATIAGYLHYN